jgi:hypothetical protein
MNAMTLSTIAASVAASVFSISALVHLSGLASVRAFYARWDYPRGFPMTAGIFNLLAAIFLAIPLTRVWGVMLGALVLFVAIVTLLGHRRYSYALPAIALLASLPITLIAAPV